MNLTFEQTIEYHNMIRRETRNARRVIENHELFDSSLVGLAAVVISTHGIKHEVMG